MSDSLEPSPPADETTDEHMIGRESPSPMDDLPPVAPPSAGFIIQLFVVPGLIVLAVIAVYLLFGKLASGEQDWRSLVTELSNSNEHRRWRGAHGLAQMLQTDQERGSTTSPTSQNPLIIDKLTSLFEKELARKIPSEDDLKFQAFLARTMGLLDAPEKVVPVLREAMQAHYDLEVRKNAVAAVAVIAGRADKRGQKLNDAALVDDLIDLSADSQPLMRQVGAFTLGLIAGETAIVRLKVLLDDPDENTQLNAAIALARSESTSGLEVLQAVLAESSQPFDENSLTIEVGKITTDKGEVITNPRILKQIEVNNQRYQRDLRCDNALLAIQGLTGVLTAAQRTELVRLVEVVAGSKHLHKALRYKAEVTAQTLQRTNRNPKQIPSNKSE